MPNGNELAFCFRGRASLELEAVAILSRHLGVFEHPQQVCSRPAWRGQSKRRAPQLGIYKARLIEESQFFDLPPAFD